MSDISVKPLVTPNDIYAMFGEKMAERLKAVEMTDEQRQRLNSAFLVEGLNARIGDIGVKLLKGTDYAKTDGTLLEMAKAVPLLAWVTKKATLCDVVEVVRLTHAGGWAYGGETVDFDKHQYAQLARRAVPVKWMKDPELPGLLKKMNAALWHADNRRHWNEWDGFLAQIERANTEKEPSVARADIRWILEDVKVARMLDRLAPGVTDIFIGNTPYELLTGIPPDDDQTASGDRRIARQFGGWERDNETVHRDPDLGNRAVLFNARELPEGYNCVMMHQLLPIERYVSPRDSGWIVAATPVLYEPQLHGIIEFE